MKTNITILITFIALLFASCSPRVSTKLQKKMPPRSADSVMVFLNGDPLPDECDTIGFVRVRDTGFTLTSRCRYPQVLALATDKTAKAGGNALYIDEHLNPNPLGSSCHRIRGTMLLLPSAQVSMETAMAVQTAEIRRDVERVNKVLQDMSYERPRNEMKNVLKAETGPGLIYSKIYTSHGVYRTKGTFDLHLEYEHVWSSGLAVGINYLRSQSWFGDNGDLRLHYVGPCFIAAMRRSRHWGGDISLGIGYAAYKDAFHSGSGVGLMFDWGVEYVFNKHVGLGASFGFVITDFSKPSDIVLPQKEIYGFRRINLLIGPRFYF